MSDEQETKVEINDEDIAALSGIESEEQADLYAALYMYNAGSVNKALVQINKLSATKGGEAKTIQSLKQLLAAMITDEVFDFNKFKDIKLKTLHKTMFDLLKAKAIINADIRRKVRSNDTASSLSESEKESILKGV